MAQQDGVTKPAIVVGISGSIAARKSCEILEALKSEGFEVHVCMTQNALNFLEPGLVREVIGRNPFCRLYDPMPEYGREPHVTLGKLASVMLVAPASHATMVRLAHGPSENSVTLTALNLGRTPIVIAPAMSPEMWYSKPTQRAYQTLKFDHKRIVEPERGRLASGEIGIGRLASTNAIIEAVHDEMRFTIRSVI